MYYNIPLNFIQFKQITESLESDWI